MPALVLSDKRTKPWQPIVLSLSPALDPCVSRISKQIFGFKFDKQKGRRKAEEAGGGGGGGGRGKEGLVREMEVGVRGKGGKGKRERKEE